MILIFEQLCEYHFFKDVGQFPVAFSKYIEKGQVVKVLYSAKSDLDMPKGFGKYIKIINIKKSGFLFNLFCFLYILFSKDKIVMMFHLSKYNMIMAFFVKLIMKKVYIKSDLNIFQLEIILRSLKSLSFKGLLFKFLIRIVDLVSIEDIDCFTKFKKETGFKNIVLIPNFIDPEFIEERNLQNIGHKKKIKYLVVGRPGDPIKNVEFILKIAKNIDFSNGLEIHLCGGYTNEFRISLEKLNQKNIFLRGSLSRHAMMKEYSESIGILLPSLHEGFPLCALEAIWFGCYVIASPVGGMKQITNFGENGKIIDLNDEKRWVDEINDFSKKDNYEIIARKIADYAEKNFNSSNEIKKILRLYE